MINNPPSDAPHWDDSIHLDRTPIERCTLSDSDLAFYREHGYLRVQGGVREETLALSQTVLERWVDSMAKRWKGEGLISDTLDDAPFGCRLLKLWEAAGRPLYARSPRKALVSPEMFEILRAPEFLDLAQDLLGSSEISVHGIFNARPKLPSQKWTDTPWHQDAQYFREAERIHVPSFWYPLQDVTIENSCLQVAADLHGGKLHEGYDDPESGFIGMLPEDRASLTGVPIEMKRGDVLLFTQMTPHGALPNKSNRVRWSLDIRYEDTLNATQGGREKGFIARSQRRPESVSDYETWLAQWTSGSDAY